MTQYMKKDMILHTRNEEQCALGRTRVRLKAYCSAPWDVLRTLLLLLLLMVGVNSAWGQDTDYSGFWYINNQKGSGYYFVPTINCCYDNDEDKPHLTTFKTGKDRNSIWRIEPVTVETETYYRIIHNATGKYLMANTAITDLANINAAHRKRVHLETLYAQEFENLNSNSEADNSLFVLTVLNAENRIVAIKSKNVGSSETGEGNTHWYLNPRGETEHFDSYRATEGRAITDVNGTVGFYGKDDDNSTKPQSQVGSQWKLETATSTCANPVIQYTDASTIQISYPISDDTGWVIYYTTDGSDPSSGTGITDAASISAAGVTKVRAIAKKEGWDDSEEAVLIASGVTQMIQSKECDAFYMVPPIVDGETYATTSNIPNAAMGWNFVPAGLYCGIQYYNIINAETNDYLYCNVAGKAGSALVMKAEEDIDNTSSEQIDRAKFRLIVQADGSYKLIAKWWAAENPTGGYYITKAGGNDNTAVISTTDGSGNNDYRSNWNVIAAPSSPKTQFDDSFASSYSSIHFYEIQSATNNTFHVLPPTTPNGNATANTTGANPAWFFMPVDDNDSWIPYYHIRNAATGEYLYFNGTAGAENTFFTSTSVESGNEDRYLFIVVKSANTTYPNHYNIIPKALKDNANQANNSMNRNDKKLRTQNSRTANASNWKLAEVALFCNDPEFTVTEDGTIRISCDPDITRIYYTTDGTEPNPNDESQRYRNTKSWSVSNKLRIKVKAVVKNETTSASSAVYTLLNKPNVTLADGPYTYNGNAWAPSVTVSIGTGATITTAPTEPATYAVNYENNTNAGTASVTVTDANENDNWYLWNIPTKTFTIDKASLTATVDNVTVSYGDPIPTYTATYTGSANEEIDPGFAPEPTFSCDYTPTSSVGTYPITISGGEALNYKIASSTPGTLTVGQKSIGDGTNIASSLTLSFGTGGAIILKDGETKLTENTDYVISGSTSESGKYSTRTVSGKDGGNYTGSFIIKNANVTFTTDDNESEWSATFVADPSENTADNTKGHAVPDGMRAFIITGIEEDWAIPEQLDYIPEGIPVLLVSDKATGGFVVKNASDKTPPTSTNWLVEVKTDWVDIPSRSVYLLYNNEFVLNNGGTGYTLSAGKVYLSKTAPGGGGGSGDAPARLRIKWNTVSGITELRNDGSTESQNGIGWYSIDGRRLNGKPSAKGLYIVDGKKIMIK